MKGQSKTCVFCTNGKNCVALNKRYCEVEEKRCSFYKQKKEDVKEDVQRMRTL